MRLGELIDRLAEAPRQNAPVRLKRIHEDGHETYSNPGCLDSWRGAYENTTLDAHGGQEVVGAYVEYLRARVGQTMIGYKGGEYVIDEQKPVFADTYGNSDGWMVVAVEATPEAAYIIAVKGALYW